MTAMLDKYTIDTAFRAEFMDHAVLPEIQELGDIVSEYEATRKKALVSAIDLGIGERGRNEILGKMADSFLRQWMMTKYAGLDLSFTKRKWYLKVERDFDDTCTIREAYDTPFDVGGDPALVTLVQVSRFFEVSYDLHEFALPLDDWEATQIAGELRSTRKYGGMPSMHLRVSAVLPDGISASHVQRAQEAMGHYYMALSLCYARGINLLREMRSGDFSSRSKVKIIWAPNVEVLTVTSTPPRPAGDPAIVLSLHGQDYLLDFYDTPDEMPITNLIREFNEGKFPKLTSPVAGRKKKSFKQV